MRNMLTIARKELRGYFDHPTAYILLVVFLVLNFFFYFRGVFLTNQASLRSMFDLLPWVFLFFIPAVTMGALAEERRLGTIEVALSQPIRDGELLLGKFLGDLGFIAIALAATLFVPLLLLLGGKPDFGVIVAQYIGAILLAGGITAVGLFASALTRNQITAFIVATAVTFTLMMVGTEVVQIGLPAWIAGPLGQLGILPRFANVARGVIDLRDIVYFVSLCAAFLSLAHWLLLRDRLSRKGQLYRNLRLGTVMIVAIAVVANLFGNYIPGRLDLTSERLYTLSDGTKAILRDLDDVVTITFFVSNELPPQVQLVERDVSDVLRDFRRYGRGNVQVIRKHPDQSEDARQEAQQLGVTAVQFNVVRQEELQVKQGWLGLAVQYAGESEVIPFVGDYRTLEYQLATNAWRLTRARTPKVAFISGHGEKTQTDYGAFGRELGRTYEVTSIDLSSDSARLGPDLDAIIVAGPKQAMDARSRQMLQEYLQRDGRLFYLAEGVDVNLQYLFASELPDSARNVSQLFGVGTDPNLVFDLRSSESIQVPGQVFNYVVAYPFWLRALPAEEHPITKNLNSVVLPWASTLDTVPRLEGRQFTPLLVTSPYAAYQQGNFEIRPETDFPYDRSVLRQHLLAVAVQGAVRAGVAGGPAAEALESSTDADAEGAAVGVADTTAADSASARSSARLIGREAFSGPLRGRAVVVGDSDFLMDQFLRGTPEGAIFALNALDWLTQTDALLGIRSKQPTPRPLVFESNLEMQAVKYLNLIGVPLAFIILGVVRLFRRRRLTRRTYAA